MWYHKIIHSYPELAGVNCNASWSIDKKIRLWVENGLREKKLKVVVCTSSLDLGVDFSPVEACIQVEVQKVLEDLFKGQVEVDTNQIILAQFIFFHPRN